MIAALYVDVQRGPYQALGADCWDVERDATRYAGPGPVVAHPPCGHWGRYAHRAHDDGRTGPIAVDQVRRFGGVLEHPRASRLWPRCGLPLPGGLPDAWGGFTIEVCQRDWGHRADKPTWIYIVGVAPERLPSRPPPQPPREAWTPSRRVLDPQRLQSARPRGARGIVECMSRAQRHLTPPDFAAWLLAIADSVPHTETGD